MLPLQGEKHLTQMINGKDINFIIKYSLQHVYFNLAQILALVLYQINDHMSIIKESLQDREHQLQSVLESDELHHQLCPRHATME